MVLGSGFKVRLGKGLVLDYVIPNFAGVQIYLKFNYNIKKKKLHVTFLIRI